MITSISNKATTQIHKFWVVFPHSAFSSTETYPPTLHFAKKNIGGEGSVCFFTLIQIRYIYDIKVLGLLSVRQPIVVREWDTEK